MALRALCLTLLALSLGSLSGCDRLAAAGQALFGPHLPPATAPLPGHHEVGASGGNGQAGAAGTQGRDMVSAVSLAGTTGPIQVKFRLGSRPVIGRPLHVAVEVIVAPGSLIGRLYGSFYGEGGLKLASATSLDVSAPTGGSVLDQQVTVEPQRAGVLTLDATVLVETNDSSIAHTFSIPIIAIAGSATGA